MPGPPLVVIGASAGGIEALHQLLPRFPSGFSAAVAIVVHRQPIADDDRLARVLAFGVKMPVMEAADNDPIVAGRISVAPANLHLSVVDGHYHLFGGPRENGVRPAVDVLFRSAAAALGANVIGILLSGSLSDGSAGMAAIKARGGRTIVQDPRDATFADMPRNALASIQPDAVLPVDAMAAHVERFLADRRPEPGRRPPGEDERAPSPFSCPEPPAQEAGTG